MRKKIILLISSSIMLISCNFDNEYDFLNLENSRNWNEVLLQHLEYNRQVLNESDVRLMDSELIQVAVPDSSLFLNTKQMCFPVYNGGYERFHPASLLFIQNDTATSHVSLKAIRNRVNQVIDKHEKYDFVRLRWNFDSFLEFETVAVFDRKSGELIYDNLLCNLIDFNLIDKGNSFLTRSEVSPGNDANYFNATGIYKKTISVNHSDYTGSSSATLNVKFVGHFVPVPRYDNEGNLLGYWDDWYYDRDESTEDISINSFAHTGDIDFHSSCYINHVIFNYIIWVGPSYSIYTDPSMTFSNPYYMKDGNGEIKVDAVNFDPRYYYY